MYQRTRGTTPCNGVIVAFGNADPVVVIGRRLVINEKISQLVIDESIERAMDGAGFKGLWTVQGL